MNLAEYKQVFDQGVLQRWHENIVIPKDLQPLWEPLWPILLKGKRIRGYLAEVGMGQINGNSSLGLALELLHAFALVHDDIMDQSDMRRGHPSVHSALAKQTKKNHQGVSYAILLGDWLLVESYAALEVFFEKSGAAGNTEKRIRSQYTQLLREMVFGQMMDISLESDRGLSLEYITEKTRLKTALYTFARPFMLGLLAAGANKEQLNWAQTWGTQVGLGFQLQDDLLDIIGDPKQIGKSNMMDVVEDSGTFFRHWILTHGTVQ